MDKEKKDVYTVQEVADLLQCHRNTVVKAIEKGDLKSGRIGNSYRISRDDLEAFYQQSGGGRLFAQKGFWCSGDLVGLQRLRELKEAWDKDDSLQAEFGGDFSLYAAYMREDPGIRVTTHRGAGGLN